MFSQKKKPWSSITPTIEGLCEQFPVDDLSGIPNLVDLINLQPTGPEEASRVLRKKLKYGNMHQQLRALVLLDGLIQNAGPHFQTRFADEALLERLRVTGLFSTYPEVNKKAHVLFRSWAADYKDVRGMERVAKLYKELPKRKTVVTQEVSKAVKETDNPFGDGDDDEEPVAGSSSRRQASLSGPQPTGTVQSFSVTSKDKKKKDKDRKGKKPKKPFNLEAEQEQLKKHIAEASLSATNLLNTLQTINREKERISENPAAAQLFEVCKELRRKIVRYIYYMEGQRGEEYLGGLLHANDELVKALITYEQYDRAIDVDSDSDDDVAEQAHLYRMATEKAKGKQPAPPRPSAASKPSMTQSRRANPSSDEEGEDQNDPFSDRNAVDT